MLANGEWGRQGCHLDGKQAGVFRQEKRAARFHAQPFLFTAEFLVPLTYIEPAAQSNTSGAKSTVNPNSINDLAENARIVE